MAVDGSVKVIKGAVDKISELNKLILGYVPSAFPVGMTVHWSHGHYTRSGVVDFHPDNTFRAGEIGVRLKTGSIKWISVTELHEYRADRGRSG